MQKKTKNLIKIVSPILGIALLALFVKLFSFSTNTSENEKSSTKSDSAEAQKVDDYNAYIRSEYKVFAIPLPPSMNFAGEEVPIQDLEVRNKIDKELVVNTYWHSQTILFHKRASRWFPVIEPILKEQGIPDDFKYLALIESGLENVVSPAGARGFWQFMKSTGRSYDLEINSYVDERYHVEKATKAACDYLNWAYNKFNSWTLAAASYNMGTAGLAKRLEEQQVNNYFDLYLNPETARYIYRILAAKQILNNSENHGFRFRPQDLYEPYKTTTVEVDSSINDLVNFAIEQNTTYKILKILNPWMRRNILPNRSGKTYEIKLPAKNSGLNRIGA